MKYRNFLLLVMVLLGCVLSCEDELETSPPSQEVYVSNFGISSARRYFESTAKDLSYLSFRKERPRTKAGLSIIHGGGVGAPVGESPVQFQ